MNNQTTSKRILVVDDEPDIVKVIEARLKAEGYFLLTTTDPFVGLSIAKDKLPDLIIADLSMPGVTGWKFAHMLRHNEKYVACKDIPIIILSALIDQEGPITEPQDGDYCLSKPLDTPKLLAKVKELLKEG